MEPVITTVDQADIRGLGTTLLFFRQAPSSLWERGFTIPLTGVEGYAEPGLHLFPRLPLIDRVYVFMPLL